jgi:hypothetical protein
MLVAKRLTAIGTRSANPAKVIAAEVDLTIAKEVLRLAIVRKVIPREAAAGRPTLE